jgi:hypothetical protein
MITEPVGLAMPLAAGDPDQITQKFRGIACLDRYVEDECCYLVEPRLVNIPYIAKYRHHCLQHEMYTDAAFEGSSPHHLEKRREYQHGNLEKHNWIELLMIWQGTLVK